MNLEFGYMCKQGAEKVWEALSSHHYYTWIILEQSVIVWDRCSQTLLLEQYCKIHYKNLQLQSQFLFSKKL